MKAVTFTNYGGPEVLNFQDIPEPSCQQGEVLVKIHAASVNSWDWDLLHGRPWVNRLMFGLSKPKKITVLGCDIAGTVVETGPDESRFKVGDQVFGDLSGGRWGGFAEYVCADAKVLAKIPEGLDFLQAAAIPQAGVLALQGLRQGKIAQINQVLINGGGGGVGAFAIQLAKMHGVQVTCVDRQEKFAMMQSLGSDQVINYKLANFTRNGLRYDLILDVMGFHSLFSYRTSLTPSGTYVMVGGGNSLILQTIFLAPVVSRLDSRNLGVLAHKPDTADLQKLASLAVEGKVKPVIDKVFGLNEVPQAFNYYGDGLAQGKIVIQVTE